jgi:outer membrane protein OmpA-like peptidoglycan-associated protein/tetratricopeptide (TPR) repeat protein
MSMKTLHLSTTLCLLLFANCLFSQYDPSKINKKAVQYYNQAMERLDEGNYKSAGGLLQQALESDKNYIEAMIALAGVNAEFKNHKSSLSWFEKAFEVDSEYTMDYKLAYSILLAGQGQFEKALEAINELLTKKPPKNPKSLESAQKRKRSYEFAVEYAKNNPVNDYVFAPHNVGANINTAASEYLPSLTIDGNELIFTRRLNNVNEDFFQSKLANGLWETARPIDVLNTPMSEAAQNISSDGQWFVFTANNRPDSYGNYDLYISYATPQGWSEAVNLGATVNSDQWDSQPSLSPDKKELYFASRRYGGIGGMDIYVCRIQPNGRWGPPENLGANINTPGDDQCPFIHADNQTLYFVSNGLQGYGGNDLFVTRKGYAGAWEKVKNLGYPINTIYDEGTLFVSSGGNIAYYASDREDTKGGHDIYSFELRQDLRPYKTLWVKGQVTDKKTTKGLPSTVELIDLQSKQSINKVETDAQGNYFITLPLGKDYAFSVNRKGYLFYSDNFPMINRTADSTYEKNIVLQPIETNASVVLNNIFFDVNKYELKTESQVELDRLVQLLNDNPTLKIEISGHTDNVGKPADNLLLSNNRAKAVVNYLAGKNIPAARLTPKGYGETRPVSDNKTEEGRAKNRRTEMKVVSQ